MINIKLATNGLDLIVVESKMLTSENKKTVVLNIVFDASWNGFTKSATFKSSENGETYEVLLDNDACLIPWEVLQSKGVLSIGVRGVKSDGYVKASDLVDYKVKQGAKGGESSENPTPTVYEQIVSLYTDLDIQLDVERKRIDALVALPDGSTTGDAELQDIRTGADGTVYDSAGNAIRAQFRNTVENFKNELKSKIPFPLTIGLYRKLLAMTGGLNDIDKKLDNYIRTKKCRVFAYTDTSVDIRCSTDGTSRQFRISLDPTSYDLYSLTRLQGYIVRLNEASLVTDKIPKFVKLIIDGVGYSNTDVLKDTEFRFNELMLMCEYKKSSSVTIKKTLVVTVDGITIIEDYDKSVEPKFITANATILSGSTRSGNIFVMGNTSTRIFAETILTRDELCIRRIDFRGRL